MRDNVTIIEHPLIKHKVSLIRDKETNTNMFRTLVSEVGKLMVYEITRDFELTPYDIETPIAKTTGYKLKNEIVIVPILRAGLGMVEGIHDLLPTAKVGHIGLFRNEETLQPELYYCKFPKEIVDATVLLVDPMLATGGSLEKSIEILKEKNVKEIIYVGLIGSRYGVELLSNKYPDVRFVLACLDETLNENGYIVPGLGDCGDRIFGTK